MEHDPLIQENSSWKARENCLQWCLRGFEVEAMMGEKLFLDSRLDEVFKAVLRVQCVFRADALFIFML